jgi:hypothetical protein
VYVLSQDSERQRIGMLGVSILALTTSLIYDFGVFPAVWHVLLLFLSGSALYCGDGRGRDRA